MPKRSFRVEKSRAPLMATTLVLIGGIITCLAVATPFAEDLTMPLLIIAGMIFALTFVLSLLRSQTTDIFAELYAITFQKEQPKIRMKLKRLRDVQQTEAQRPPTAEDIRKIKGKD